MQVTKARNRGGSQGPEGDREAIKNHRFLFQVEGLLLEDIMITLTIIKTTRGSSREGLTRQGSLS